VFDVKGSKEDLLVKAMDIGIGVDLSGFDRVSFAKDLESFLSSFSNYKAVRNDQKIKITKSKVFVANLDIKQLGIFFEQYNEDYLIDFMPTLIKWLSEKTFS